MISDEVDVIFSFQGGKGKHKFCTLRCWRILCGVFLFTYSNGGYSTNNHKSMVVVVVVWDSYGADVTRTIVCQTMMLLICTKNSLWGTAKGGVKILTLSGN